MKLLKKSIALLAIAAVAGLSSCACCQPGTADKPCAKCGQSPCVCKKH